MANFAGGGFSTGFARGAAVRQNQQALKLQGQQFQAQQSETRAAAQAQALERLTQAYEASETSAQDYFESQIEMINTAAQQGATDEQIEALAQSALMGPNMHARFVAQLRAQATAAGATPDQLALMPDPEQYLELRRQQIEAAAGVGRTVAGAGLTTQQFREGDDFVTRRVQRGVPDMTDAGVISRSPIDRVQRVEQGGVGAFSADARTDSQTGEAAVTSIEQLEDAQRRIIQLTEVGSAIAENPRTAGVMGWLNETVGGAVGQVSPSLATGLSMMLTGVDPQRAAQLRADYRVIVAQNLTNITGEESGRYTEAERQIAEQTLRTLPLNASAEQVAGAFGNLFSVELSREARELMRQGKPQRFQLIGGEGETVPVLGQQVSVDGLTALDTFLIDAGISSASVRDSVARFLIATQVQGVVPIRGQAPNGAQE